VDTVVDAVSRQRLTAAPSLSACEIVANGEPDVLPFPMNADLTMVAVELHGVLSHDRDCKASDGDSNGLAMVLPIFRAAVSLLPPTDGYHRFCTQWQPISRSP
jgi:hypothetical protein